MIGTTSIKGFTSPPPPTRPPGLNRRGEADENEGNIRALIAIFLISIGVVVILYLNLPTLPTDEAEKIMYVRVTYTTLCQSCFAGL